MPGAGSFGKGARHKGAGLAAKAIASKVRVLAEGFAWETAGAAWRCRGNERAEETLN